MEIKIITPGQDAFLRDESHMRGSAEWICFPESRKDALDALSFAREKEIPVTVQGGLTGLSGGAVPQGGLILNLSHMKEIGDIQKKPDGTALLKAQAGVTLEEVRKQTAPFVFPVNPTEETATLGGIFATAAAGPWGLGFGRASSHVEGLTWLTPEGAVWEIERNQYVSRNGSLPLPDGSQVPCEGSLDLIDFLSGREEKMGLALEFTWRLQPAFRDCWGLLFFFDTRARCLEFGEKLQAENIKGLLAAESYNRGALTLLRSRENHPLLKGIPQLPEADAIYLELEGPEERNMETLNLLLSLFEDCGGHEEDSWAENDPAAILRLQRIRHALTTILGELGDSAAYGADLQGRPKDFRKTLEALDSLSEAEKISCAVYGHLLTNGLHCALLPETEAQRELCPGLLQKIGSFAMEAGGSLGYEYGPGKLLESRYPEPLCREFLKRNEAYRGGLSGHSSEEEAI